MDRRERVLGIVAYISFIGTIVAYSLNVEEKSEYIRFHVRQMMGLILFSFVTFVVDNFNQNIGLGFWAVAFVCWTICLSGALQGKKLMLPIFGSYFQKWFKTI